MAKRSEIRGLKKRPNKDGTERLYWTCNKLAQELGYQPKTVPLHQTGEDEIESYCALLEGQMLAWIAEKQGAAAPVGEYVSIGYLANLFQDAPSSKFHFVKWKTQEDYRNMLLRIERQWGHIAVNDIDMDMAQQIYSEARWPDGKRRGAGHVTMARNLMAMIKRIVSFGLANKKIAECRDALEAISAIKIDAPQRREEYLTFEQAEAIITWSVKMDRLSIALGTALQFECLFRQKDVIGEWEPFEGEPSSPYVLNGRQWVNGLTWDMVGGGVFEKKTVKRQKKVSHDLSAYPMTSRLIAMIPEEKRSFGAVIIDERTGRPYARWAYGKEWGRIARLVGVPEGVWNLDCRAGGISEALAAQASLADVQKVAGHADPRMTIRYERMTGLDQAKRAAEARTAYRVSRKNS